MSNMLSKIQNYLIWFAIFTLSICIARSPILFGGNSYIKRHDTANNTFIYNSIAADHLKKYGPSYWLPEFAAGTDRMALDVTMDHFSEHLFVLFKPLTAYQIFVFLHYFLFSFFGFLVLRESLQLNTSASFAGSILGTYLISPQLANDAILDIAYQANYFATPFVIWAIDTLYKNLQLVKTKLEYALLCTLTLFTGVLLGGFSSLVLSLPYTLVFLFGWFICFRMNRKISLYIIFFIVALIGIVWNYRSLEGQLAVATISPRIKHMPWRFTDLATTLNFLKNGLGLALLSTWQLLTHYWLGATVGLPLAYAVYKLNPPKLKPTLMLTGYLIVIPWILRATKAFLGPLIPQLNNLRFERIQYAQYFAYTVAISLMIQSALNYLNSQNYSKKFKQNLELSLYLITFLLILTEGFSQLPNRNNSYTKYFGKPEIVELKQKTSGDAPFRVVTTRDEVNYEQNFAVMYGFEVADGYLNFFPKTYYDFWKQLIYPTSVTNLDQYNNWINDPGLINIIPNDVVRESNEIELASYLNLSLLSLANVRFIFSAKPIKSNSSQLKALKYDNAPYIYENLKYMPRYFTVNHATFFRSASGLANTLQKSDELSFSKSVYLIGTEDTKPSTSQNQMLLSKISPLTNMPDALSFEVTSEESGYFVALNSFSPYWIAEVNQKRVELLAAYGTFWAVPIIRGLNQIKFNYNPPYK